MKNLFLLLMMLVATPIVAQTQKTIDDALLECFKTQSLEPLSKNYETVKTDTYWAAYNQYLQAVYLMKSDKDYAAKIEGATKILTHKPDKNSEDYALLASITSLKMSTLADIQDLMQGENDFYQYIEKAKELDENNPRVYYVAGLYDYYKPAQYGGGTKAKEYLTKAVELFESQTGEITWGVYHSKEMLKNMD